MIFWTKNIVKMKRLILSYQKLLPRFLLRLFLLQLRDQQVYIGKRQFANLVWTNQVHVLKIEKLFLSEYIYNLLCLG